MEFDNEFVANYLSIADNYSHANDLMNIGGMLCLLGQCTKNIVTNIKGAIFDNRIHVLCIQKSGSGKGPALNLVRRIAKGTGFSSEAMTSLTSAGLIGTLSGDEIIYGPASYCDLICFQEAGILFKNTTEGNDLIYQINQITDTPGRVNKRLARGSIEYGTNCSLFLTTHPPKMKDSFISSGFLPRLIMCYKDITTEVYDEIREWMVENIGEEEPEYALSDIIYTINNAKETMNYSKFVYEKNAFRSMNRQLKKASESYSMNVQDFADIYSARMLINGFKIANALAFIDCSKTVDKKYAEQSTDLLMLFWKSTLEYIEKFETSAYERETLKFKKRLERLFNKYGNELTVRIISQYLRMNKDEIDVFTNRLIDEGYSIEKKYTPNKRTFTVIKT